MNSKNSPDIKISVPSKGNPLLAKLIDNVNSNVELKTLWRVTNVNALDRLKMTDHGIVHFQIVANIAIKLTRTLNKHDIKMGITKNFGLTYEHTELVVFLGSILHDLGMSISREGHEEFSLFLANDMMKKLLDFLPEEERTIVISETLHAIISHRKGGTPYTIEAGIVRVADALDMTKGRSRETYETGFLNIHSISEAAIESVEILDGQNKPLLIQINMNNSAGIFQVDELLKSKLKGSGLEKYIEVTAFIESDTEKKLLTSFSL